MRRIKGLLSIILVIAMLVNGCIFTYASESSSEGVAVNTTTNQIYDDISVALNSATAGDTVVLNSDVTTTMVCVLTDVELDLNGHTLEASYVTCFGNLTDRSETGEGLLKIPERNFLIQRDNAQLPVKTQEGYRFFDVIKFNTAYQKELSRYAFQPFISAKSHELLSEGSEKTGVTINVRVSWKQNNGKRSQNFVYNDDFVKTFFDSYSKTNSVEKYGKMFTLVLSGSDQFEGLTFESVVSSDIGVEFVSKVTMPDNNEEAEPEEPGETIVVTRENRLLPDVKTALPESALAAAPGVVFKTAPYAYINKTLFAGKHITRIGIPVKSVKALDENQTFTLSVVKTTSDTYQYVSQNVLNLPKDQLGDFTTVNKWIYVDVDLQLARDETLAFGMPTDTVEWGYSKTKNSPYTFRSATGSWNSPINESILFDIYTTETLEFKETEYGLAALTKEQVFPNVHTDFPESAIAGGNPVEFTSPPYSYTNQDLFSGSRITKIGIPVQSVKALDDNQTFTLSVIKKGSGSYQYVSQHTLTLPIEQLGNSTTVNKWIYLDLDLQIAEDETLAFGGKNDTVSWGWKRGFNNSLYQFRDSNGGTTTGIFFDIYKETVLTYEDYLKEVQEEQDRIEAEKEQARQDALLKEKLSGKGISILGDSISTFQGWSNNTDYNSTIGSNAVYYTGSRDGFAAVTETWWMQTITRSGLDLVVNNAWSGDRVVDRGISRALQLHNNDGKNPDIIAVYLGINDFRTKVTEDTFREKYDEMISGMLRTYYNADVYLFTLLYTSNVNSGVNPSDVVKFNEIIKETAERYNCTLVDIYTETGITKENLSKYMGDGTLHPNYAGMDLITKSFMDALMNKYLCPSVTEVCYSGESQFNIAEEGLEPVLKLKVTYSDESTEEIDITDNMYVVEDSYVKPDFTKEGTYSVKVIYEGVSTTFDLTVIDPNILIRTEEFTYGSYFDHDRFQGNTGTRLTSGSYILIRAADALLPAQEITIKVTDTNLTDYKVTLGYYTKDGIYTGRTGILPMTNGELTIKASEIKGAYFRVNVYLYNGKFTKVPESAVIVVYGKMAAVPTPAPTPQPTPAPTTQPGETAVPQPTPTPTEQPDGLWEGKKICILGDSISTGSYPSMLANMTGATIQNLSVSGTLLTGGLTNKVTSVAEDADLVIVYGGTNDYWHKNVNIGTVDSTETNTFNGALRYILNYLKTNRPNAKYLFVFPPNQTFGGKPSTTDFGKGTLDDFRDAFLYFCEENDVPYLNLADTEFDSSEHTGDGVHPNSTGHGIIAEAIYDVISNMG